MRILVTGGAGFVGSAVVRHLIKDTDHVVVNLDKLTYAGNLESIAEVADSPRYHFERGDICDPACVRPLFARYQPHAIMHLAAESHVDRSIDGPAEFVQTNVLGTYTLLEAAREHCLRSAPSMGNEFRFLHVSTDEVYGSLGRSGAFDEQSPYRPNSPYAATKAAADHLVRAWGKTYGLSVITTHCTNCYGPYQFPEKLIPLMILTGLAGKALPVYGRGDNVRDWLHVDDHARALTAVLERGAAGETYNIGGRDERTNLEVVHGICGMLDELAPLPGGRVHASLISFVADRPGHDYRYAVDSTRITRELGWRPLETFTSGLRGTVRWYLDDPDWCHRALLVRGLGHDSEPAGERLASAA